MQSSLESSVSLYKKCVGNERWEKDEGIEKRAAGTFAEMCKVYGEENAIKMVSITNIWTSVNKLLFRVRDHDHPAPAAGAVDRRKSLAL